MTPCLICDKTNLSWQLTKNGGQSISWNYANNSWGGKDNDHRTKAYQKKFSLIDLAEYLQNVSQACKINGVSRQHFYDIKKAFDEEGIEGLREKSRRKPCMKNRVAPEIEEAVINMA